VKKLLLSLTLGAIVSSAIAPDRASAAGGPFYDPGIPNYTQWQKSWDRAAFRNPHVIVGEVIDFRPYRVRLRRSSGKLETVDLKHGTQILPVDATPTPGERVALVGYYSNGTFVADRLIIR